MINEPTMCEITEESFKTQLILMKCYFIVNFRNNRILLNIIFITFYFLSALFSLSLNHFLNYLQNYRLIYIFYPIYSCDYLFT